VVGDGAGTHDHGMSTIEQNKATVTEFVQSAFTKGDLDAAMRYLSEGFVNHDPVFGGGSDRSSMREAAAMTRTACPDWHSDTHLLVGEGDIVVEHFTASGTHQGELFGAAPTGRTVTLPGINIWRVRDGLITDRWGRIEEAAMLAQLGLSAPPGDGHA
jgi:predicted ester cyclase